MKYHVEFNPIGNQCNWHSTGVMWQNRGVFVWTWQPYSEDAVAYWYYFLGDRRVNYYSNLRAPLPVYEPNIWLNPTLSISRSFLYCTDSNNLHNMFRNLSVKLQILIKQNSKISCSTSRTGVPDGAARQKTRSSGRIWASWEKKPWQISWLGNLNERLASWKYEKFMPVLAG